MGGRTRRGALLRPRLDNCQLPLTLRGTFLRFHALAPTFQFVKVSRFAGNNTKRIEQQQRPRQHSLSVSKNSDHAPLAQQNDIFCFVFLSSGPCVCVCVCGCLSSHAHDTFSRPSHYYFQVKRSGVYSNGAGPRYVCISWHETRTD